MNSKDSRIIIENQQSDFLYQKSKSNLNITFNRISFIFFIFFIISLIYSIHLIHLGSRKIKKEDANYIKQTSNKLYRADIVDINQRYLVKLLIQ
jgi:cell division protein FtsI (penicillin-binding protein 3)